MLFILHSLLLYLHTHEILVWCNSVAESNTPSISTSLLNKPWQTESFLSFKKCFEYTPVVLLSFLNHLLALRKPVSAVALQFSGCWMLSAELRSLLRLIVHWQSSLGRNVNFSGQEEIEIWQSPVTLHQIVMLF